MIVGVDATFLLYFFAPPEGVGVPLDFAGQPISMAKERVQGLIAELEKQGSTIIVGTPALSEIMVRSGVQAGQSWLAMMNQSKAFKVVPFDAKSAIEVAIMGGHMVKGETSKAATGGTYAKLKYDRQIVAIAATEGATTFYTDDVGQRSLALRLGMSVRGLAEIPIPTTAAAQELPWSGGI
ncbi:hypothetical protein [Phenylobacterium sp.]|uniref:hypothetical protein n=1 Tax=Phenylobacterium sp. TaxID=1871053 RepID=UPI002F958C51